jgi:hypothetical protein
VNGPRRSRTSGGRQEARWGHRPRPVVDWEVGRRRGQARPGQASEQWDTHPLVGGWLRAGDLARGTRYAVSTRQSQPPPALESDAMAPSFILNKIFR